MGNEIISFNLYLFLLCENTSDFSDPTPISYSAHLGMYKIGPEFIGNTLKPN